MWLSNDNGELSKQQGLQEVAAGAVPVVAPANVW